MTEQLRVCVTSIGSLLGQNILDMLEPRRPQIYVIGTNLDAINARIFRSDVVYLVPPTTETDALEVRLRQIIDDERPHLILGGRDHDVLIQAKWRETHPELIPLITAGPLEVASIMQDKWLSYRFANERDLPFAATAICGADGDRETVLALAECHGYPILAKPREGYGSLGTMLLRNTDEVNGLPRPQGYVFQQFLDPPRELDALVRSLEYGIPLFFSVPESTVFVYQTTIGPRGTIAESFCMRAEMVIGRNECSELVEDPELVRIGRAYADAMAGLGWIGPFNLQCKRTRSGSYAGIEMNGRMSGASSARMLMGYDEVEILVRMLLGEGRLEPLPPVPKSRRRVIKTLVDGVIDDDDVTELETNGVWRARTCR